MTTEEKVTSEKSAKPTLKTTKGKTSSKASTPETVIYIGESLPNGALQQFSIFKNSVPVTLKTHFEQCPAIESLIIPISKLAEARKNLLVKGTVENVLNTQVQKYVRGEK
ncbi:hypothetical protein CD798_08480 [Bacillaceae bacterium SAOS 7]|nr:hypothetical protein CD798_08480 [Bacillaceae bacterium SAOS 7]